MRKDTGSAVTSPLFRRILIANRGEIAVRVIRACHELGIEAVAVYSDADEDAPHVRAADLSHRIGPAAAADSYLDISRLIAAARESGAEAIHPGYGFLSERAEFAAACREAGLVFVGPEAATLAGLGDKLAARRTARDVGVAIVPGTFDAAPVDDPAVSRHVAAAAAAIGWPLLVKAAAGGGGRGMRRVERSDDLPAALVAASQEAHAAFGDGAVYLERFVEGARHVEVQLLGDGQGTIVALGERDCSIQRRHQKLLEEAPAPGLTRAQRAELHQRAVTIAAAVGLRNAATAEFLFTADGDFWFLEVNARLQVEHGVTELVTGLDLVHEQLRIAAGLPLTSAVLAAAKRAADPDRHAIEMRISAEDPSREFAPTPGLITAWIAPGGPGVRFDSGVRADSWVPSEYDPLLAKLLVVAPDRATAIARASRALDETSVGGIQTTIPFHRWLLRHEPFRSGALGTDLVARDWDGPAERARAATDAARAAVAAIRSHGPPVGSAAGADIAVRSGWRTKALREGTERLP